VDTHLQRSSLGLRQDGNASKASDDVRTAADYDRDTAVFIRGAFEAERRGNTSRELIGLVLAKAISLSFSISLELRCCGKGGAIFGASSLYRVRVSEVMLEY
jgi:hypothetical protein